ncbi:unnamed protein product [Didymodactylos carnosus]|uniref:Uncharacterized protein n=1 Tax=Didymodactylos carnosus TaxID=1234261 RepID=A0A814NCA0_9BILA|nr:unnamed protein product [Didymodactylos carnosus]CAF3855725.1 unnamed protein product [Didymodactylos carnosus]
MDHSPSTGSVSSIASSLKKSNDSHVLIRGHKYNCLYTIPLANVINPGNKKLKRNEDVTFKLNMQSREQLRGKMLLFGDETLCNDQMQVINEAECLDNASTSNKENEAFHETPFPGQSGGAPLDSTQVKQKSMKHNKLTEPISKEQQITAEIKKQKEIKKAKSSEKQQQEATIKEQRPSCSGQLKGKQKPAKKISHGLNTEHRVSDSGRKEKRESEMRRTETRLSASRPGCSLQNGSKVRA